MDSRGRFITFEGGEGAGKSTQIKILADRLRNADIPHTITREPGGSPGAEILRHLILSGVGKALGSNAEALLFAAARDDHVRTRITPALDKGVWVLCDRFSDSTRVYQGKLGKVDPQLLDDLERVTIGDLKPDLTLVLDVPVEAGMARAASRRGSAVPDRFESEDTAFHRNLRAAYMQLVRDNPARCVLVDAASDRDKVAAEIWSLVTKRFPEITHAAEPAAQPA